MPKPRIFVSSTYYDLKYIRNDLQAFIENYGFESVLFEHGNIAYDHYTPLDSSCYRDVKTSQMLILIIGGRYGSESTKLPNQEIADNVYEFYNSITREEYRTAIRENIPTYIFIDKQVHSEYRTYMKNKDNTNINYASVDSINVFRFIEEIHNQFTNNIICDFEQFDEIKNWLQIQWSGLFYNYLFFNRQNVDVNSLSDKITELGELTDTLKNYLEEILIVSDNKDAKKIISREEQRRRDLRKLRTKDNILESSMVKYLYQHTDLDRDAIYQIFVNSNNLEELLNALKIDEKEKSYILAEPNAATTFSELKALLI